MHCRLPIICKLVALALLAAFLPCPAHSQSLVPTDEIPAVVKQIASHPRKNTLECDRVYLTQYSNLGFDLRYHAEFALSISLGEMTKGGKLEARLRVTPQEGAPTLFGEYFDIPSVSQALSTLPQPANGPILASVRGGFVIGPGKYTAEILLISPDNKTFFKKWNFKTEPNSGFAGLMKPNTVAEVPPSRWDGKLNPNGIRLTLLLNATAKSPFQARLWDYHFLLAMVSTVFAELPCQSVRIVAFNLDQQGELFRSDSFTLEKWDDLEAALKGAQLSTVDYRTLGPLSKSEFLTHLAEHEISGPSDAVVLVGRWTRFLGKTSPEMKAPLTAGAKLYYLRRDDYPVLFTGFGPDDIVNQYPEMPIPVDLAYELNEAKQKRIPDSITSLVRYLHGAVLPFTSSHEFGKAIEQIRAELASPSSTHN